MKYIIRLIIVSMGMLWVTESARAQVSEGALGYFNEALLFSRTNLASSARIQGLGGAQIALGGDISNIYANPAGLGFFNRSQAVFTPTIKAYNNEAEYFGLRTSDSGGKFGFNNLGVIFSSPKNGATWKGGSFGISYTKTNNFNDQFTYEGRNPGNSLIDQLIEGANGTPKGSLGGLSQLAFDTYLINPALDGSNNEIEGQYDSFVFGLPLQSEVVETEGSQSQWNFSYGGNVNDKVYFGIGIGLASVDYEQTKIYTESNFDDADPGITDFSIRENLKIDGTGLNATFGLIIRPNDYVRIGASVQTPTYYQFDEESELSIEANYPNFFYAPENINLNSETAESDIFISEYDLTTPLRLNGGLALFFNKNGFISADVSYVDYSNGNLASSDFSPNADNRTIEQLYTSVVNIRVGGEYRYDVFRFRGGIGFFGDPYVSSDIDQSRTEISLGAGVKFQNFFADLAVTTQTGLDENYFPYTFADGTGPTAFLTRNLTTASLTFGFNF